MYQDAKTSRKKTVMPDSGRSTLLRTTGPARIETRLRAHHVEFRPRPTDHALPGEAGQEEVLALYRDQVDRLCAQRGFRLVDVARMTPHTDDPEWTALAGAARQEALLRHRCERRAGRGRRHVRFAHSSRSMPKSTRS